MLDSLSYPCTHRDRTWSLSEQKEKLAISQCSVWGKWLTHLSSQEKPVESTLFIPSCELALHSDWPQHVSSAATCLAVERQQRSLAADAGLAQRVGRCLSH